MGTITALTYFLLAAPVAPSSTWEGGISVDELHGRLARSLQYLGLCSEGSSGPAKHFEDNLRLIKRLRPRFIGRAAYAWDCPGDDEKHYRIAAENATRVHAIDPDIVLQACVFETVYSSQSPEAKKRTFSRAGVETLPVPDWVFREFGQPVVERAFDYEGIVYADGRRRDQWGPGASVPDVSRLEARMWLYYRAKRYIDAGYDAIHFGQPELMGRNDRDFSHWAGLLARVRRYAAEHGRRRYVLLDAHVSVRPGHRNLMRAGTFLWDFASFPLRPVEEPQFPLATLRARPGTLYGRLPGGLHPSGWRCDVLPQLYEFDNCSSGLRKPGGILVWGCDEATWFANLQPSLRNQVLHQFYEWVWRNSPGGHLQLPGRRPAHVPIIKRETWMYICNDASPAVPEGFGQEQAILDVWGKDRGTRPTTVPGKPRVPVRKDGLALHLRRGDAPLQWPAGNRLVHRGGRPPTLKELRLLWAAFGDRVPEDIRAAATEPAAALQKQLASNRSGQVETTADPAGDSAALTVAVAVRPGKKLGDQVPLAAFVWAKSGYYLKHHAGEDGWYAEIFDGSGERRMVRFGDMPVDRWTHLAFTSDGKWLRAYRNGVEVDAVPAGTRVPANQPLTIGQDSDRLRIDHLQIWRRVLPADQIKHLAKGT